MKHNKLLVALIKLNETGDRVLIDETRLPCIVVWGIMGRIVYHREVT